MRDDKARLSFGSVTDRVKDNPATDRGDVLVEFGQAHDGAVDRLLEVRRQLDLLPRWLVTGNDPSPFVGPWNSTVRGTAWIS